MLNRAPFNTEVPQFLPSREAPINSYITRKYPCQEHLAEKTNEFGTLTWKIQQPDPNMVWQSVKVVLPMEIQGVHKTAQLNPVVSDMNVVSSTPACNIALSQSPMNAFRQTSLSINGRIFSEDNFYRDILDTCYRGVGTQAYGDNHSLKPIVNRGIHGNEIRFSRVQTYDPVEETFDDLEVNGEQAYARTTSYATRTVPTENTLLEHNGPFIERARIFQDNLSYNGKTWKGDISHLLELGPFQARARKGNTAVPYIQDFHLRLNFANMPSKFDVDNGPLRSNHDLMNQAIVGRVMSPKLLEFATPANFLHKNEVMGNYLGWPVGFTFKYTAQPYLEIVYTKHESGMRDSYNLRCFEHLYEKSNRFPLVAPADSFDSPKVLSRVTSRLLSCPTKVYVWGEVSDEYKYTFAMGGVRRSCRLENLHLRVNQRPDVMFNPSQEECYEMFRRHTNSSLEYGSWRKSPIYVFDMVDVGQPDMYSNDARITWFEWDAEVQLTELQMAEQSNLVASDKMEMIGYDLEDVESGEFNLLPGTSNSEILALIDHHRQEEISSDNTDLCISLVHQRTSSDHDSVNVKVHDAEALKYRRLRLEREYTTITGADVQIGDITDADHQFLGCIWAQVWTADSGNHVKGDIASNQFFYIPESFRFQLDDDSKKCLNTMSKLTFGQNKVSFTNTNMDLVHFVKGRISDSYGVQGLYGKHVGTNAAGNAKWAPGVWGYTIDGHNIHNDTALGYAQLPKVTEGVGSNLLWVAFAPTTDMPSWAGYHTWLQWKATLTIPDLRAIGLPYNWVGQVAGEVTDWGLGYECANIKYDVRWNIFDREEFDSEDTLPDDLNTNQIGPQLVYIQAQEQGSRKEDYQLKVLYEYGNCQYNFSRSAAPTRVLPNVVPVGPSPGIPAPL